MPLFKLGFFITLVIFSLVLAVDVYKNIVVEHLPAKWRIHSEEDYHFTAAIRKIECILIFFGIFFWFMWRLPPCEG